MAGLQRAHRRTDPVGRGAAVPVARADHPRLPAKEMLQDNEPGRDLHARSPSPGATAAGMARPRIGAGARVRQTTRRRNDGTVLLRVLGISAAALILGTGGLLAFHAMAPVPAPGVPAAAARAPAAAPAAPAQQAAARPAADHVVVARRAAAVASLLGAPVSDAVPPRATAPAPPDAAPTAADFARPAFLEPLPEATTDQPEPGAEAAETAPPAASVPLPAPRPAASSEDDGAKAADARTARIRSSVTLRSGPRRSASAIGTLERGTRVTLYSCKSWCEVSSGTKRGFVYKSSVAQ